MPLKKPARGTQSPEINVGKENRCQLVSKNTAKDGDVPTHLPAHSPRDQPDSPEQELGRIVKSEHVVVVLHVILIEQGVQLLELQDQTGVLSVVLRTNSEAICVNAAIE